MSIAFSRRAALLVALVFFAASASHAQGLGGMLNRAKTSVGQAASRPAAGSPGRAMQVVTQAAPPTLRPN